MTVLREGTVTTKNFEMSVIFSLFHGRLIGDESG